MKPIKHYNEVVAKKKKANFQKCKNLEEKIQKAQEVLNSCIFCERRCGNDRTKGEVGFCGVSDKPHISSQFIHVGEEAEIIPSYTIFFSGCTFECVFCQNWDISRQPKKRDNVC